MQLSKTIVSAGIITAVAAGSIVGVSAVNAQSSDDSRRTELIERIAADTGVDAATIEASFESFREEKKAEREAARAEHLDSLVEDGTLTQEQRDELEARFEERKTEMMALKESGASREELRELKQEARAELEAWAEEEGIELEDIKPEKGDGFGRRGHRHFQANDDADDSSVES